MQGSTLTLEWENKFLNHRGVAIGVEAMKHLISFSERGYCIHIVLYFMFGMRNADQ